jgi:phage I-like protein
LFAEDLFLEGLDREIVGTLGDQGVGVGALESLFDKRQPVAARGGRETFGEG